MLGRPNPLSREPHFPGQINPAVHPIDTLTPFRRYFGPGRNRIDMETNITREKLIELLNEDLSREYQAIIAYVVYSQVIKGAQYMSIASELEKHAGEELRHALIISKQIDYLGGTPTVQPKPVKLA